MTVKEDDRKGRQTGRGRRTEKKDILKLHVAFEKISFLKMYIPQKTVHTRTLLFSKSYFFKYMLCTCERDHHVVEDDRHAVVEQGLAKHVVIEVRIHSNLPNSFNIFTPT